MGKLRLRPHSRLVGAAVYKRDAVKLAAEIKAKRGGSYTIKKMPGYGGDWGIFELRK